MDKAFKKSAPWPSGILIGSGLSQDRVNVQLSAEIGQSKEKSNLLNLAEPGDTKWMHGQMFWGEEAAEENGKSLKTRGYLVHSLI